MSRGEVRKTRDGDVHVVCDDERMSDRIQSHTRYRQTVPLTKKEEKKQRRSVFVHWQGSVEPLC